MSTYRIRFEGPAPLALGVATALAEADGVELVASEPPRTLDTSRVALDVSVEGALDDVLDAVSRLRDGMPTGASIEMTGR